MEEGLDVGLDQFNKMSSKDRDSVMFQNMVHIRGTVKKSQFESKIHRFWLIGLTGMLGIKRLLGL
jgi:hypothetical protein